VRVESWAGIVGGLPNPGMESIVSLQLRDHPECYADAGPAANRQEERDGNT
jgi:hypothetical protein